MKKTIIILCMMIAAFGTAAYGAELIVEDTRMDYGADSYLIELRHSANEERPVTVQMKNKENKGKIYFSQHMTGADGAASIKIPMDSGANPSGEYTVRLSGADIETPKTLSVTYVNKADAKNIIAAIKENAPGLADYIRANIYGVGLEPEIKKMWDGIGEDGQNATVKAVGGKTFSDIGEVEKAFSYALCTFLINNTDPETVEAAVLETAGVLRLDIAPGSYFSQIENKQAIWEALAGKNFSLDKDDEDENSVRAAFKTAAALAWINESGAADRDKVLSVIKDANEYLGLSLDGDFADLNDTRKKSVIIKMLEYKPFANKRQLADAFEKTVEKYVGANESGGGSGGSGGSGGGGGSSSGGRPYVPPVILDTDKNQSAPEEDNITEGFKDIENHWAKEYIEELSRADIIAGTGGGLFSPDRNILREEFVKIIVRSMGLAPNNSSSVYEDVRVDQWYYPYIVTAEKSGLVYGIDDTHFGVGKNISRQDMAVLVARMLGMKGVITGSEEPAGFTDQQEISDYAAEAVNALAKRGIISGDDTNTFHPGDNATRAEAAKMMSEALKQISSEE